MSQRPDKPFPHERRIQRHATVTLVLAAGLASILVYTSRLDLFGVTVPRALSFALIVVGVIAGVIGVRQRRILITGIGAGILALAVVPATLSKAAAFLDHVLAIAFGLALLIHVELVHMTERYELAHRAVDEEGVPEEHVDRVTDEALKTLAFRGAVAALIPLSAVGIAYGLRSFGPTILREAVETTEPLGVALLGLVLLGAATLYVLIRGAEFRRQNDSPNQETAPDVVE